MDQARCSQGKLKDGEKLTYYVDNATWTDSAFKASPYTVMVEVNADMINTNSRSLLLQGVAQPEFGSNGPSATNWKRPRTGQVARCEGIDKEAYDRVRKPLMKKFDIEKVVTQSFAQERAGSASSSDTSCSSSSSCTACR
jgi:hypothetical protein